MKKTIITTALAALSIFAHSQSYQWSRNFGYGSSTSKAQSVAIDAAGNTYTVGNFSGSIDVDASALGDVRISAGANDLFIIKSDATGALVWAHTIGSTGFDEAYDVVVGSNGYVTVVGSFSGTVDFDPGAGTVTRTASGNSDVFVALFSASGSLFWVSEIGGTGNECANSVAVSADGYTLVVGGYFESTCDFMPGAGALNKTSNGGRDGFAVIVDVGTGSVNTCYTYGGSGDDVTNGVAIEPSYAYVTGSFSGTVDFDPTAGVANLTAAGQTDIHVVKLSQAFSAAPLFAQSIGNVGYDEGRGISTNGSGLIAVTGYFEGFNIDFDMSSSGSDLLSSNGSLDAFVLSYNTTNNSHMYAHNFGGIGTEMGFDVCYDNAGAVYFTGVFASATDFDPGAGTFTINTQGGDDCFFAKLDAAGNFVCADPIQSSASEFGQGVSCNANGAVAYAGYFNGASDFDPTPMTDFHAPSGFSDAFVVKYGNCSNTFSTINTTVCDTFFFNNTPYFASGTYTEIIPNFLGCDSIVTINLTVQNTYGTDGVQGCGSVTVNNITYYTSGTFNQVLSGVNQFGCDSIITVNVVVYDVNTGLTVSNDTLYPVEPALNIQTITWIDCNTMQVAGPSNPWFVPTATGDYAAIITTIGDEGGCTDTTVCQHVVVNGVEETAVSVSFTLQPNPGNGWVLLRSSEPFTDAVIAVKDVTGRQVFSQNVNGVSQYEFYFDGAPGVYFVTVEQHNQTYAARLIRN